MANQDIGFYKYLEAAFRYRLFNPQGITATLNTRFNYLGYNLSFNRIFFYARRVLPKFYTNEFPDTEEGNLQMARKVLEKMDRRQDAELNKYFDPAAAPTENTLIIKQAKAEQAISTPQTETTTQPPPEASKASFQAPRVPSPLVNTAKNFGSNAQIFAKRNFGRIADGLKGIVGGVGRGLGGAMSSGLGTAAPSLRRAFNVGLNGIEKLTQPGGGGMPRLPKSTNKLALGLLGGLLLFVLISGLLGAITGSSPSLKAAPIPGSSGLDYTLPLKDPSIQPVDIKDQIRAAFPGAKLEYWDTIIQRSKDAGWNPTLVLALWIEETGASQATLTANGGSGIMTNGALSKGHLGCAPAEDQTIDESLNCLFKFGEKYTNDQFSQFMAKYSGGPTNAPFSNNPNFPKNIKDWYSKLVPSGPGAIQIISQPSSGITSDCPVPGGHISFSSYNSATNTGHCGGDYGYACHCGTSGRRAKAIDVPTNGQGVILPTVNGQTVTWKLMVGPYIVDSEEGGGFGYTFQAALGNNTWYLDMLHLNQSSSVTLGGNYPSGTPVATTVTEHVHMTIGKNLSRTPVAGSESDCDPGWMASDFMCQ